ncbi:MAG: tRNA 2-thiouridine synthesizing protein D [Polaribacter sp.]|jgi:tRNA 2-thiouridine synthesizing protein D
MKNKFVILITASPQNSQSHLTAIKYVNALIESGQSISCIFFYQDAVSVANEFNQPPSDEPQLLNAWSELATTSQIELMTCIAASFRRGVIDREEAKNRGLDSSNLSKHFNIVGLGQLSAALSEQDSKLVHFK